MNKDFHQVVDTYAASLYRLACSYCGSHADAEDVVQEVFLKYLQTAPEFPTEQQLRAWLMRVTVNKCKDLLRSPWRQNREPLSDAEAATTPDDPNDVVQAALLRLSPGNQAVIYLYYYEEMSTKEIGEILKLSETAVRSRLFQARRHLKKLLGGD